MDDLGEGGTAMISDHGAVLGAGIAVTSAALALEGPEGHEGFLGNGPAGRAAELCHPLMSYGLAAAAPAAWALGGATDEDGLEDTGRLLCEALALGWGVDALLKVTTMRERPDGSDRLGFPSMHSTGAAALAAVVWREHGAAAGAPLAALAAFTALSRVHLGRHYISDTAAGLAIGAAAGLAVTGTGGGGDDGPVLAGLMLTPDGMVPFLR